MHKLPSRRTGLLNLAGRLREGKSSIQRLIGVILLFPAILTGCSGTMYPRYFGIRPDGPEILPSSEQARTTCNAQTTIDDRGRACLRYWSYVEWAEQMGQAYRSRATMNEWSVYVAGTIALGTLSAIGGLGVAGSAANETAGLLSVSSGFASGLFGFLNNSERAGFYTQAANEIALARTEADQMVGHSPDAESYTNAANHLAKAMSEWTTWLETKRSQAADAAAKSAALEQANKKLQDILSNAVEFPNVVKSASIEDLNPTKGQKDQEVTLTTKGIDLKKYEKDLHLRVGGEPYVPSPLKVDTNTLTFKMPEGKAPTVSVQLYLGTVPIPGEKTFTYQP